VIKKPPKRGG